MSPFNRVRWFHSLFVLAFLLAYFTGDEGERLHVWLGYSLVAFLVIRLLTALVKVKGFPPLSPAFRPGMAVSTVSRSLVVALLLAVSVTVATGLTMVDNARVLGITAAVPANAAADEEWEESTIPPWLEQVEDIHELAANTTLTLAGLHVGFLLAFRRRFALNMIPGLANLAQCCRGLAAKIAPLAGISASGTKGTILPER
ncbi:MAG: cytochrome b/b6 domain-containing protein [Candidatus Competibacter denitrificans]